MKLNDDSYWLSIDTLLTETYQQIINAVEGLKEEDFYYKHGNARSIIEIVAHLCEVSYAFNEFSNGREYRWGTFSVATDSSCLVMDRYKQFRSSMNFEKNQDNVNKALEYIVLHESYHVGQICLIRIHLYPDWDYYSIYPSYKRH